MLRKAACNAVAAGVFIGIGGAAYLSCENRYVGAVLFTVALLSICYLSLYLYTGRIGYLVYDHSPGEIASAATTLAGNLVGTLLTGLLLGYARPALMEKAQSLCADKLALSAGSVLAAAFFCGMLMYTAVAVYRDHRTPVAILFCVPVFILSGFEHSIADMFYLFLCRSFSAKAFGFLALVVVGNSLGGMLIPALKILAGEER